MNYFAASAQTINIMFVSVGREKHPRSRDHRLPLSDKNHVKMHPGESLREVSIFPMGVTAYRLARTIGFSTASGATA
jgi:hypothetical protein